MRTYDPKQIIVNFLGITITGFAEDSFVEVDYDEDAFIKKTGAGGEVARTRNQNKGGSVKVTLMQSSPTNDLLSAAAILDRKAGTGVGALQVKDGLGTSLHSAAEAWIKKVPASPYAKALGEREWVFDCAELEHFVGSST